MKCEGRSLVQPQAEEFLDPSQLPFTLSISFWRHIATSSSTFGVALKAVSLLGTASSTACLPDLLAPKSKRGRNQTKLIGYRLFISRFLPNHLLNMSHDRQLENQALLNLAALTLKATAVGRKGWHGSRKLSRQLPY